MKPLITMIAFSLFAATAWAQQADQQPDELTEAERALVELIEEMRAAWSNFSAAIVSIMGDRDESVTRGEVESGKMTWNVAWDGRGGPVITQWAVQGFPTVYLIDRDGTIVLRTFGDTGLRALIEELTQ